MKKYICIHGHFYQPPRENPWLEAIEYQGSAHPFHDWNERITAECYTPNSRARIEDGEGWLLKTVNNYTRMSFNIGPTLLSWMEEFVPDTYARILEADRESRARFGGHGSAVAQCYNHMIMPLANRRDKQTQIIWGIRDFEHRFGRAPEGMWLAETAVDNETLDLMATYDIRYTILEPHQCARTRPIDGKQWRDGNGGQDLTMPYQARLPSGRKITLFFYNHEVSRAVAFERLLERGDHLAGRLTGALPSGRTRHPPLVHIATDGESYGHHHRHGEMALAWALESIDRGQQADLINYGQYLELYPPTHEAEVVENTAWSCVHGVGRWERACGCNSGGHGGWNQEWRAPLREALNWLRDRAAEVFEEHIRGLLRDPWLARNDYIEVLLDRSPANRDRFFARHATAHGLTPAERTRAMLGLEMQRHAMLMFTSCGWFFDELTGIETNQIVQYAARVIELVNRLGGPDLEAGFLERYGRARSNLPEHGDGRRIWARFIKPARFDLHRVASWYAMGLLFGDAPDHLYSYEAKVEDLHKMEAGNARMVIGRITIRSRLTFESERLTIGAIHLGQHNMFSGVRPVQSDAAYADIVLEGRECIARGDLTAAIRLLDDTFPEANYSLRTMFKDMQRSILDRVMRQTLNEAEQAYRQLYETNEPLMRYVADLGMRQMPALHTAARYAILADLQGSLAEEDLDIGRIEQLLLEAGMHYIGLDEPSIRESLEAHIESALDRLEGDPVNIDCLQEFEDALELIQRMPISLDLRGVQERFHIAMMRMLALCQTDGAIAVEEVAVRRRWLESIAGRLKVRMPQDHNPVADPK